PFDQVLAYRARSLDAIRVMAAHRKQFFRKRKRLNPAANTRCWYDAPHFMPPPEYWANSTSSAGAIWSTTHHPQSVRVLWRGARLYGIPSHVPAPLANNAEALHP